MQYFCVISGFCCEADENCTLLRYYAAYNANSLPTFRDNMTFPTDRLSQIVGKKLALCNLPRQRRSNCCPCSCYEGTWGSKGKPPLILNFDGYWKRVVGSAGNEEAVGKARKLLHYKSFHRISNEISNLF